MATASASASSGDEDALWMQWVGHKDPDARATLIEQYLPYARMLAAVLFKGRFHDEVEFADYFQLASMGLMEAVDRYRPGQGAHFKTYASYRIRGTVLNGLEKLTEKNQQIALQKRLRSERLEAAAEAAALMTGTADVDHEATGSQPPVSELLAYLAEVGIGLALGVMLEGTGMIGTDAPDELPSVLSPEVIYFRKRESQHWQGLLRDLVLRLADQERLVIRCHYLQGIAFDEIGHMLGVSRSRVSQLHRQGLAHLRKAMAQAPACDVAW
ncbi:sigma-70 family RNA polymerase sigma factor [Acidovorax sp. GBBC 3334]|uniref:sigma-70 family RNA polymerase sigma factor n=1 Tax=Acidovorax sp. GBBC 3334 TaxID=2940496 RepID=UPI002304A2CC|nr:sigma-70 family RNA polymerase sigma factor [Acidovorax sp. GBBC 3334]MDA8456969.1 sigma-70 family RNA polymerase sigma factor [Acidovorax sp. GBBC 3334]